MNVFELQLAAAHIANNHIQHNIGLNESIAKLANERELSRLDIQSLVSATNHAANDALRKVAEDKTYTFTVADVDVVLSLLNDVAPTGVPIAKVASAIDGLKFRTTAGASLIKQAEAGSTMDQEKRVKEAKDHIKGLAQKTEAAKVAISMKKTAALAELDSLVGVLTRHVREYMVVGREPYAEIRKHASLTLPDAPKIVDAVFTAVAGRLEKLGHPFTGVLATDKELRKETFKRSGVSVPEPEVTVVNGDSPIAKAVVQINKVMFGLTDQEHLLNELDSFSSCLTIAEKELKTSEDVSRYFLRDLDTLYRRFDIDATVPFEKNAGMLSGAINVVRGSAAAAKAAVADTKAAKALSGASVIGTNAARGAKFLNKNVVKATDKSVAGHVASAIPSAAIAGGSALAIKAGQSVAQKARGGFAYTKGGGASDSATKDLR